MKGDIMKKEKLGKIDDMTALDVAEYLYWKISKAENGELLEEVDKPEDIPEMIKNTLENIIMSLKEAEFKNMEGILKESV